MRRKSAVTLTNENKLIKKERCIQLLLALGLILLVGLDQLSKYLVDRHLPLGVSYPVISGFFYVGKIYNSGAAFSLLAGKSWGIYVLALLSFAAGLFFIYLLFRLRSRRTRILMLMVAAGTIGNGLDRILNGRVVDFLEFHFGNYVFPSFNLADTFLVIACIVLIFFLIFDHERLLAEFAVLSSKALPDKTADMANESLSPSKPDKPDEKSERERKTDR